MYTNIVDKRQTQNEARAEAAFKHGAEVREKAAAWLAQVDAVLEEVEVPYRGAAACLDESLYDEPFMGMRRGNETWGD